MIPTPGVVLDAQRVGIAGVTVVVAIPSCGMVKSAVTNSAGGFSLSLPALPSLDLAIPALGVAGFEIDAGVPILIMVP
ncbi:MAG: carboxypeptidase-like regulatory domain-containing protein [Planctomycetota bacterium]